MGRGRRPQLQGPPASQAPAATAPLVLGCWSQEEAGGIEAKRKGVKRGTQEQGEAGGYSFGNLLAYRALQRQSPLAEELGLRGGVGEKDSQFASRCYVSNRCVLT